MKAKQKFGNDLESELGDLYERLEQAGIKNKKQAGSNGQSNGWFEPSAESVLPRSAFDIGRTIGAPSEQVFERIAQTQRELGNTVRMEEAAIYRVVSTAKRKAAKALGFNVSEPLTVSQLFANQCRNFKQGAGNYKVAAEKALQEYEVLKEYKDSQVKSVIFEALDMYSVVRRELESKETLRNDVQQQLKNMTFSDPRSRQLSYAFDTLNREVMELKTQKQELAWTIEMKRQQEPVVTGLEVAAGQKAHSYRAYANRMWHLTEHSMLVRKSYELGRQNAAQMQQVDRAIKTITDTVSHNIAEIGEDTRTMLQLSGSLGQGLFSEQSERLNSILGDAITYSNDRNLEYITRADELLDGKKAG